ncbi:hypothetical protein Ancab_009174 [Ancistrocladus abbreviatus]
MFCGGKAEEGWDLNAVVRGYADTGKDKTTIDSTTSFSFMDLINEASFDDFGNPFGLPGLSHDILGNDNNNNPFDELGDFYKPFYTGPPQRSPSSLPMAATATATAAVSSTENSFGILNQSLFHQQQPQQIQQQALLLQLQQQQQQQLLLQQRQEQQYQHQLQQRQFLAQQLQHHPQHPHPQRPTHYRCRKRKSEQKRTTCQVTAENILSTDNWAWRKYGQKPIKGSPYPRNYYRCSSSKGCTARKQVEKSPTQPNLYLVTYTGDHCHPRPTHRNSLAGSSRTKFYTANKPNYENFETKIEATVASTSLVPEITTASTPPMSPSSGSSLSPNTPLATARGVDDVDVNNNNCNNDKGDDVVAGGGESEENFENELEVFVNGVKKEEMSDGNSSFGIEGYDDVLIPNLMVDEEMLTSMKELGTANGEDVVGSNPGVGGSGGVFVGTLVPPWDPSGCSPTTDGAI